MNRSSALPLPFALVCFAVVLSGCGPQQPALAPVSGRVTLDDKPLAGATVCFVREGLPRWSFGQTDADGNYVLTTIADKDGAYLGLNQITITEPAATTSKSTPPGVPSPDEYFQQLAKSESQRSTVPARYQQLGASGLAEEINAGPNVVDLKLSTAE